MIYFYDASGSPIGMKYWETDCFDFSLYFFEKNLQGDIIAIYNASGTKIGSYIYDAWGNHTYSTTSGITSLERRIVTTYNPFRYRGYYYDVETQWYYLQTRYYNPNWGRFISADGYVSTGTGLLGYNVYAYCNNNPVNMIDSEGEFPWLLVAVATLLVANLTSCSNNGSSSKRVYTEYVSVDPGTFETVMEAVEDFGHSYLEKSISEDKEYSAVIYEEEVDGNTRYTYSVVSIGEQHRVRCFYPEGKVYVADVHTHGANHIGDDDEVFSPGDKKIAKIYHIPSYMFSPSRRLYRYDPYLDSDKQIMWSGRDD